MACRPTRAPRRAARRGRARPRRGRRRPSRARPRPGGGAAAAPRASSSSQPRSRGHSRSSASCATSASPSPTVTRRSSASTASTPATRRSRSASSSSMRDAPPHDGVALALAGQPQQDPAGGLALGVVEARVGALGQPRDRAVHAARALVGAQAQRAAVAVLPQLDQRARQQRQRRPARARRRRPARRRARARRCRPARRAGSSIARAQLVAAHRTDEHVVGAEQPRQLGVRGAAAVEVGAHGDQHQRAGVAVARGRDAARPTNAARSASSWQAVKISSNWSTAITSRPRGARATR